MMVILALKAVKVIREIQAFKAVKAIREIQALKVIRGIKATQEHKGLQVQMALRGCTAHQIQRPDKVQPETFSSTALLMHGLKNSQTDHGH